VLSAAVKSGRLEVIGAVLECGHHLAALADCDAVRCAAVPTFYLSASQPACVRSCLLAKLLACEAGCVRAPRSGMFLGSLRRGGCVRDAREPR
jgi:hypothetical protein